MNDEIEKLNQWLEDRAIDEENCNYMYGGDKTPNDHGGYPKYFRSLKNINLCIEIEIPARVYTYNPSPILDYIKNHLSEYYIKDRSSQPHYRATGSSTIYVKI